MSQIETAWVFVMSKDDLPSAGARVITGGKAGPIALFRTEDDEVFAVLDKCPHKGGPLSQGIVHGHLVTCPLHAWNIELKTGCAMAPDKGCARSYLVKCEANDIFLSASELASD